MDLTRGRISAHLSVAKDKDFDDRGEGQNTQKG